MSIKYPIGLKKQWQKGFTLLEVLAVLALVGFGLVAILSLANYAVSAPEAAANRLVAVALAQRKLEEIRYERDNNWILGGHGNNICDKLPSSQLPHYTYNNIAYYFSISSTACNAIVDDKIAVDVKIQWQWRTRDYQVGPITTWFYDWKPQQ